MSKFYTEEECKQEWVFDCEHFRFVTCRDLSKGVTVMPLVSKVQYLDEELMNKLSNEISRFTFYWTFYHKGKLNGFSGLETVKWNCKLK